MPCLTVLDFLVNERLPYTAKIFNEIGDVFQLIIGYKNVHFWSSNKVNFTGKTSFHAKSLMLCNFIIDLFLYLEPLPNEEF